MNNFVNEKNIIYEEDFNKEIQYSIDKPGDQNNATYSYLKFQEMNHVSIDSDSDLRLKINKDLSTYNVENNTFA
ncbi:5650_t:CDS:2 [Funneliformis geosporum]|uniref:5650_t:CDS:1 n=1 Tax=Funneliformis geosporum TaxID=1117311 RepID=A0A9W4T7V2_9GLOM|nr:5650_t:CDS:2 [Funneliformis geosporum]